MFSLPFLVVEIVMCHCDC